MNHSESNNVKRAFAALIALICLVMLGCTSKEEARPTDPPEGPVTKADFFFYSCVHAYMQAHSIKNFDASVGYAVEYSDLSGDELERLSNAARDFARTIPPPNYSDEEHGLQAVLVTCRRQAAKGAL